MSVNFKPNLKKTAVLPSYKNFSFKQMKKSGNFNTLDANEARPKNPPKTRGSKIKKTKDTVKTSLSIIDKNLHYIQNILPKRHSRQEPGTMRAASHRQNLLNLKAGSLLVNNSEISKRLR